MRHETKLRGALAPVVTPFGKDLAPDADRLIRHCRWLLLQDCGLAVFGTNSEANSMSVEEKIDLLDALVDAGIDTGRMMPGTGACAIPDTVRLTAHAVNRGCAGVMMLPPFYYKGVSDEGLFRAYAEVIERVGDDRLKIYLYHIPPVAQVPITLPLIERLLAAYPDTVVGVKDSSGEWSNTEAMIKSFPGFQVFAGSEMGLLQTLRAGGVGCISAGANVNAPAIAALAANWQSPDADAAQEKVAQFRTLMGRYPMIPALKATVARFLDDPEWARMRPPLVELSQDQREALAADQDQMGFRMPGLRQHASAPAPA
ncbi:MAG: dihydrodipicolinate synthase family protein [Hyphomicrobiales bacterium]